MLLFLVLDSQASFIRPQEPFPGRQSQLDLGYTRTEDQKQGLRAAQRAWHWVWGAHHSSAQPSPFPGLGAVTGPEKGCISNWPALCREKPVTWATLSCLGSPAPSSTRIRTTKCGGIQILVGEPAAVKTPRWLATGTLLFQREVLLPKLSRKPLLCDAFFSC